MDPIESKGRLRDMQKKRNGVNMEIKIAKRNDSQDKIERNNPSTFFDCFEERKGFENQVKNCSGLSVHDVISCFYLCM